MRNEKGESVSRTGSPPEVKLILFHWWAQVSVKSAHYFCISPADRQTGKLTQANSTDYITPSIKIGGGSMEHYKGFCVTLQARKDSMCGLKDMMKRLCLEACSIHMHLTIFVTHKSVLLCYMKLDICTCGCYLIFSFRCNKYCCLLWYLFMILHVRIAYVGSTQVCMPTRMCTMNGKNLSQVYIPSVAWRFR